MKETPHIIVVAGPTASGKTRLGIELAQKYNGEIVSADSMQIYRGMDIGTAKATPEEQRAVPHHMIDIIEPDEAYSAARYVEDAAACCDEILSRGKVPIVVGGTGLYIDSLISGRDFASDNDGDRSLRQGLEQQYDVLGGSAMLELLRSFDPERAARLHPSDRRRIVRAIEIYRLTGITATAHDAATRALPKRYRADYLVLHCADRAVLYQRINDRVDQMVRDGLFDEVESLLRRGINEACTSMQAIGYKEVVQALAGTVSREDAIEQIKLGSRRYAKRQMTWFGRNPDAISLEIGAVPPLLCFD